LALFGQSYGVLVVALLEGIGLSKRFGGILALNNVDFSIEKGQIVGLIGPNGAGKTTLFNAVAGAFKPSSGRVLFDGQDLKRLMPYHICRRGIARTYQVARPFAEMTCMENVLVAAINRPRKDSGVEQQKIVEESLEFIGLTDQRETVAKNLNLIDKKKLEMARALATEPKLLLLDEVLGGLNTQEINQAIKLIRKLRDERGQTIFWIEHVMGAIMNAAERVIVLNEGRKLMEGKPAEVANDERVIQAYLGHG
jgi:branched-chain amino acid transport system ATP-binding protein